jgi:hypothetical protein
MYPSSAEEWINAVQFFITYLWSSDFLAKIVSLSPEKEFFFLTDLITDPLPIPRPKPHSLMIPQPNGVQKEWGKRRRQ